MAVPGVRRIGGMVSGPADRVSSAFAEVGNHLVFYAKVIAYIPSSILKYFNHIVRLIAEISFGSATILAAGGTVGVVFAMSFVSGAQVGLEGFRGLDLVGLAPLSGAVSGLVNTRELAPVVAGIALAAKVGTGFTAQLGAMRISEEIDALEVMSVNSLPFLVTTRMIAAFITVIPLYLVGLFAAYVSTRFVVVQLNGQSGGNYDYWFNMMLPTQDVFLSLAKAVILAMVVTMIHCYYGYNASGGPEGVGRAAGRALRTSIVMIMIVDILLTFAFWGVFMELPGLGGEV
ncbi:MAG: ABC transporter permease [Actinophytocola sp.]|nr:ABC transporter permease [Actinophytocola sp.]